METSDPTKLWFRFRFRRNFLVSVSTETQIQPKPKPKLSLFFVERLSSTAGDILTPEGNKLCPETAENFYFWEKIFPLSTFSTRWNKYLLNTHNFSFDNTSIIQSFGFGFGFGFDRNFWVSVSVSPKPKNGFRWITISNILWIVFWLQNSFNLWILQSRLEIPNNNNFQTYRTVREFSLTVKNS